MQISFWRLYHRKEENQHNETQYYLRYMWKKFDSKADNAKYCSAECKVAGIKINQKNWYIKHPDYDKNRMKVYRDKKLTLKKWKV